MMPRSRCLDLAYVPDVCGCAGTPALLAARRPLLQALLAGNDRQCDMGNWLSGFDLNDLDRECESSQFADPLQLRHAPFALVYGLGLVWAFGGIAFVAEEYFAASIEGLIIQYRIPPNIAGATLMAAGSSMPELVSALVALFFTATQEAGSATVVGSALFNQLVIIGGCILVAPNKFIEVEVPSSIAQTNSLFSLSVSRARRPPSQKRESRTVPAPTARSVISVGAVVDPSGERARTRV